MKMLTTTLRTVQIEIRRNLKLTVDLEDTTFLGQRLENARDVMAVICLTQTH